MQYIVKIITGDQTSFYNSGAGGMYNQDSSKASRFQDYHEAAVHMAEVLNPMYGSFPDPLEIRIVPIPEQQPEWTFEEILAREG